MAHDIEVNQGSNYSSNVSFTDQDLANLFEKYLRGIKITNDKKHTGKNNGITLYDNFRVKKESKNGATNFTLGVAFGRENTVGTFIYKLNLKGKYDEYSATKYDRDDNKKYNQPTMNFNEYDLEKKYGLESRTILMGRR